ncbi:MAG: hypothetical protein J0G30_10510 [Actinomycetales bacterium]|nr:hypothetical protein [Actinomycetales bacterium]
MSAVAGAARPRRRWDGFRRISAGAGLLEAAAVLALLLLAGRSFTGHGPDDATVWTTLALLGGPAVLAGLVSGSRFVGLYAGYAERLDPTAALSTEDAAEGSEAASSVIGDGLWGSLIAGVAGSVPASVGLAMLFGPVGVVLLPLVALVVALAWFTGWVIGAVVALILGTALGIALGSRSRATVDRLPWILVAVFLPLLLVAVAVPTLGVRFDDGRVDVWSAILLVAGLPVGGAEIVLPAGLVVALRVTIWLALALFVALVLVGTPALLHRRRAARRTPPPS